jgi:hypothetical protein
MLYIKAYACMYQMQHQGSISSMCKLAICRAIHSTVAAAAAAAAAAFTPVHVRAAAVLFTLQQGGWLLT